MPKPTAGTRPSDSEPAAEDQTSDTSDTEAGRVIRHRITGHKAALELADQLHRPESLEAQVEETEHRLAEDEDILEEITPDEE